MMSRPPIVLPALCGTLLSLVSCATPKATVVAAAPAAVKTEESKPAEQTPVALEPELPPPPDDGSIPRMPNFLDLPSDGDFRPGNSPAGRMASAPGVVTVRPPTDPPSRVKPKPPGQE